MSSKSHTENYWLRLGDYQRGAGIPLAKQILLVKNRAAFKGLKPVIAPYAFDLEIANRLLGAVFRFLNHGDVGTGSMPDNSEALFLGHYNRSLNQMRGLLVALFRLMQGVPDRKFDLTLGKGDYEINHEIVELLPGNLESLTANNVNVHHPRIRYLPMGRDFRNGVALRKLPPTIEKTTLVYCNFSLNTHPIRQVIYSLLQGLEFVKFAHMGNFLDYSTSRKQFFSDLAGAKFAICPRGNGLDTFRMWDCLYLGTVPIVVKEATFHDHLDDLPILFLSDASKVRELNKTWLEDIYANYQNKEFNYSKLFIDYWMHHTGTAHGKH